MSYTVQFIPNPALEYEWNNSPEAAAMMLSVGERVKAAAVSMAPLGPTGDLKRSIYYELSDTEGGKPMVIIGTNIRYGGYVEFGTYKDEPQPYLRPALDEVV